MTKRLLIKGGAGERELLLVGLIDVGRDAACAISHVDPLMSRRHAEFVEVDGRVVVRDLDSRNGIRVNGVPQKEMDLRPGDLVQIANLTIEYLDDGERTNRIAPADPEPEASDKTVLVRPAERVAERPAESPKVVPAGKPAEAPAGAQPVLRKPHAARFSWGGSVLLQVVGLAALVILILAIPMMTWQDRTTRVTSVFAANGYVNWLAAETGEALDGKRPISEAADAVAKEPGVVDARILSPDGRVLAPASRANQTITDIPGVGVPADVLRNRAEWNGTMLEVVRPVRRGDDPRAALVWVTFRPATASEAGSLSFLLAPALVLAFGAALLVGEAIRRTTTRALVLLNEDIELAMAGQLEQVTDPLGAKPMKDLTATVNYLISRLRSGAPGERRVAPAPVDSDEMAAVVAAAGPATAVVDVRAAVERAPLAAGTGARLVANSAFRVTDASQECAELIGASPDQLIGKHLVDAVRDPQIADAILRCLGAVGAAGEDQTVVIASGTRGRLGIAVNRAGKEQPITITVTALDAVESV
jgi:PAS domain-containing protein